jgi:hypothetical protein
VWTIHELREISTLLAGKTGIRPGMIHNSLASIVVSVGMDSDKRSHMHYHLRE